MSYMQFQQRCRECGEEWNAAFGLVGMTLIAQPPVKCPRCGAANISKFADGWKLLTPPPAPNVSEVLNVESNGQSPEEMSR